MILDSGLIFWALCIFDRTELTEMWLTTSANDRAKSPKKKKVLRLYMHDITESHGNVKLLACSDEIKHLITPMSH